VRVGRWLVAALMVVVMGGCGTSAGDGDLIDDWATIADATALVPVAGCHDMSTLTSYQIRTQAIPCDQPHTVETIHVGQLPDTGLPAASTAGFWKVVDDCERITATFLGGRWYDTRVDLTVMLPSKYQWDAGGRWFRCDLREIADNGDGAKRRTGSLRLAAEPLRHRCVKMVGSRLDGGWEFLRPIDCAQPHEAEYAGSFPVPSTTYPTDTTLQKLYRLCYDVVALYIGGTRGGMQLGYTAWFVRESVWNTGDRYVRCYARYAEGMLTRSVVGLGNGKPG
jgi:hypothetical protein